MGELIYKMDNENTNGIVYLNLSKKRKDYNLAPGIYIYVITNDNDEIKKGKFAIIK